MVNKSRIKSLLLRLFPRYPLLVKAPSSPPTLFLTFDDGPCPAVTGALLELLNEQQVKASFFCIGKLIAESPETAEKIVAQGHQLANHSYNHKQFSSLPVKQQLSEIEQTDKLIERIIGRRNKFFRVPQGRWSAKLVFRLRLQGRTPVHWTYDSMDYQQVPASIIEEYFTRKPVANGDVILFHDDNLRCVDALRQLLPKWKEEGFEFRRIDEA